VFSRAENAENMHKPGQIGRLRACGRQKPMILQEQRTAKAGFAGASGVDKNARLE